MEGVLTKIKFKNDTYTKKRGTPALLKMSCSICEHIIMYYQKDGPGPLKRCYLDRIFYPEDLAKLQNYSFDKKNCLSVKCPQCKQLIGFPIIYEKENRPAFKLVQGAFSLKKIPNKVCS
jgi:hypothetical protein